MYNTFVEVFFMNLLLKDLQNNPSIIRTYDYHDAIESLPEILTIAPVKVIANATFLNDSLTMDVLIEADMQLACAKTLKPVDYHLKVNEKIIFGNDIDADFILEDAIPFKDIIFGYILSEKPLVVYHPDAKKLAFKETKHPHPAFADLKQFLKK